MTDQAPRYPTSSSPDSPWATEEAIAAAVVLESYACDPDGDPEDVEGDLAMRAWRATDLDGVIGVRDHALPLLRDEARAAARRLRAGQVAVPSGESSGAHWLGQAATIAARVLEISIGDGPPSLSAPAVAESEDPIGAASLLVNATEEEDCLARAAFRAVRDAVRNLAQRRDDRAAVAREAVRELRLGNVPCPAQRGDGSVRCYRWRDQDMTRSDS